MFCRSNTFKNLNGRKISKLKKHIKSNCFRHSFQKQQMLPTQASNIHFLTKCRSFIHPSKGLDVGMCTSKGSIRAEGISGTISFWALLTILWVLHKPSLLTMVTPWQSGAHLLPDAATVSETAVTEQRTDSPFTPRMLLSLGLAYCLVFHCNSSWHLGRTGVQPSAGFKIYIKSTSHTTTQALKCVPQLTNMCMPFPSTLLLQNKFLSKIYYGRFRNSSAFSTCKKFPKSVGHTVLWLMHLWASWLPFPTCDSSRSSQAAPWSLQTKHPVNMITL